MNPKFLKDKDPWMLAEDVPDMDFFFSQIWLNCFVNLFHKQTGRAYKKILAKYIGYHLWFYFGEKDSFKVGENIVNRIVNEKEYADKINKNIIKQADILRKFCEDIPQKNFDKLSNKQLWKIYNTHDHIHKEYYTWGWMPVAADMFHNNLTNRVKAYLGKTLGAPEKINEYFIVLTQPTKRSLIYIEQEELLNIARVIEKNKKVLSLFKKNPVNQIKKQLSKDVVRLVNTHWQKYYYTKHIYVKGEYTVDDYLKQIKDIITLKGGAKVVIEKMRLEFENNKLMRNKIIKKLKLNKHWQNIFTAFGDFMVTKIYRRYAQIFAVHHMSPILKEIAHRNNISEKQVRFMLPLEIKALLLHGQCNRQELQKRTKLCVYYAHKNSDQILTGASAIKILESTKRTVDVNIKELKGQIGCLGKVVGKVKIIIRAADMAKMQKGDILVSIATDPDIVPAMKKAAAIVTEQGGVTSHAAIVSRELNIPCVIGTKIATKVFRDGDIIEVDANKGIVRKIN